jgi:PAS domain S-box-containing protein
VPNQTKISHKGEGMEPSKSLRGTINWSMIIITILSVSMVGSLWIVQEYLRISSELRKQKDAYIAAKKTEIKAEVDRAIAYINYKRTTTEQQLKDSIKTRVYEAHAIANGIYNSYHGLKSELEIQEMIKKALRPLIFNEGRGYFFIYDMRGNNVLLPFQPHLEGNNIWNFKDSKGTFTIRAAVKMIREKGEGFQRWYWYKPGENKLMSEKIGFSKHFDPYDWWIGTGEYIEDFEQDIQKETLEWINSIRFGQDGYIFVYDFDGTILAHFMKETIGNNVIKNPKFPSGAKIVAELIRISQQEGGGFLEYEGLIRPSTGLRSQKIGFSRSIKDWQWTVGAGVYVDSINDVIATDRKNLTKKIVRDILYIFVVFVFSLVIIGVVLRNISRRTTDHLTVFTRFFKQAATKSEKIDENAIRFSEFKLLANDANQMVDDRKKAENALRISEERLDLALSATNQGIWDWNMETDEFHFDPRYYTMSGYEPYEFPEAFEEWEKRVHPEDVEVAKSAVEQYLSGESRHFDAEFRFLRKEGDYMWIRGKGKIVARDDQGNPARFVGTHADITERKQAEEALQESESRLSEANKLAGLGYWEWNINTREVKWSEELYKIFRLNPAEFTPQIDSIMRLSPWTEYNRRHEEVMQQLIGGQKQGSFDQKFLHPDDTIGYYHSTFSGKYDKDGNLSAIQGTAIDITERKQAEEELKKHRERLEELVYERTHELKAAQKELLKRERLAVLGQLTATVSHELRNPLGVIRSSTFYLQRSLPDPDEKVLKHLIRIDSQINTCDNIISDLLEYTRSLPAEKTKEEIARWLGQLIDEFYEAANVRVDYQPDPELPPVFFDREKMQRVVLNLLTNAVHAVTERKEQAQKEGDDYQASIHIQTWRKDDHVIIQVEDNGIGMDDQTRDRAFEPLFTTRARGTGIGLALVMKIVKEHDGSVSLESKLQEGTKIKVMLPLLEKVIV